MTQCAACGFENPTGMKCCGGCGEPLPRVCPSCAFSNPPGFRFCGECAARLEDASRGSLPEGRSYTPQHIVDKILKSGSALQGELKQVTVLFADIVDSMPLSEQVGPEEWHDVLDRLFRILSDAVHRFEGTVNQYTGDGIMALFGAPIAHEDHAQRACYAALNISDDLRPYTEELRRTQGLNLSLRMGLNSGEVVVGKIGDDLRLDYTAQGLTVGLAARIEAIAEPHTTTLTARTAELVEGFVTLIDLGEFELKGVREPVYAYELGGVGPMRTRLDVSRSRGLSSFVGRSHEMATLELALERARAGRGQVVGIEGEPGVGKSRLCLELAERCRGRGFATLEARCPAHGRAVPFLLMRDLLRAYFGIGEDDSDDKTRQKIAGALIRLDDGFQEMLPVAFAFLGVDFSDRPSAQDASDLREQQLFAFFHQLVQTLSTREPMVLLIDDLHWVDAESDRLIAGLTEVIAGMRVVLLLNYRPGYRSTWMEKCDYLRLPLFLLRSEETDELLVQLIGAEACATGLGELVRERTEGNPFFIEELVRSLLESGTLRGEPGAYQLRQQPAALEIPLSVQSILAARMDRIPERDKRVLHTAAVIGKEFEEPILERVVELPRGELVDALGTLTSREFLHERALYPVAEYAFRHRFTHEVAYRSQLRNRRKSLHAAVARAIEATHADSLDEQAGRIAHHWREAGDEARCARWQKRAAALLHGAGI